MPAVQPSRIIGRYELHGVLATGGMATVYLGRLVGSAGFARTVAIKRMHTQFARDPEFVAMFVDEARLAGHIRHPNVVPVTDAVSVDNEVLLVMEYVDGETLAIALRRGEKPPPARIVSAIVCDALDGLHAAHEARDEDGVALSIVHRDVSPQNIMVGADGVSRVLDFGVAKAANRTQVTRDGQVKGKLAYMSPEQLRGEVSRASDVWAMGVVLWEALTNRRLFAGENPGETVANVMRGTVPLPSSIDPDLAPYNAVVLKALAASPETRFTSALEMSIALGACAPKAEPHEVGAWLRSTVGDVMRARSELVSKIQSGVGWEEISLAQQSLNAVVDTPLADAATRVEVSATRPSMPTLRRIGIGAIAIVGVSLAFVVGKAGAKRNETPAIDHPAIASATAAAPTVSITRDPDPLPTTAPSAAPSIQPKPHPTTRPATSHANGLPEFL